MDQGMSMEMEPEEEGELEAAEEEAGALVGEDGLVIPVQEIVAEKLRDPVPPL